MGSINTYLRRLSEEDGVMYFTTSEAAKLVGVSERTLRRLRDKGVFVPRVIYLGGLHVYTYTTEDLQQLRVIIHERKQHARS